MYDILVRGGTIIDGSGQPMYKSDVGIKDGIIKSIGDLHNEHADRVIDAEGLFVTPGFIDINNHSDTYWRIFLSPNMESLLYQGVTTIVGGNCGSSLAPLVSKEIIKTIQKWVDVKGINLNWLSVREFLAEVEKRKLPVNFGTLVGHSTLRRGLIGDEIRNPTTEEIYKMEKMLKNAMREGALGLSTGLVYTHAKKATEDEIMSLAEIVKRYDGVYTTHVRGESAELIKAIEEAVGVAQKTGVKLEISHLKAMGEKNWHLMDEAINLIETARMGGLDVSFDVYPYTSTGSVLYIILPDWVAEGGKKLMIQRLKNPEIRGRVVSEMKKSGFDYSKITISISPLDKTLSRRNMAEIAKSLGKSVEEAIVDILVASDGHVVTMMEVLSDKNVEHAIRNPFSLISSNGSGYSIENKSSGELVHPRNFGSFPRILSKYVREKSILGWEEAIRKMTGMPAEKYGLEKRGKIAEGNFADIAIFDRREIGDLATTDNPYQYSKGIDWLLVNGKVVIDKKKLTDNRSGMVLRRKPTSIFEL